MRTKSYPLALVTGAPGWLGTRLVQVLLEGISDVNTLAKPLCERRVRCLVKPGVDASPLRALGDRLELVEGDVADMESLESFFADASGATLLHVAGIVHPTNGTKQFYQVNALGTRNVVVAAERAHVRRIVHVSSNSPLGANRSNNQLFDENSPYKPYMGYGRSKLMAEKAVLAASERGRIETAIIRSPWFYGPNHPARQGLFVQLVRDGRVPIVGAGENLRSMAYIDNICQGILLCEQVAHASGNVYWIADRKPYSLNEIVDTIEFVLEADFGVKCAHKRMRLPGIASALARCVDEGLQSIGLYHQTIHVLSEMNKTIACSIAKAERELGYDPKIDLREGMRRSIRWMIDQGGGL